MKFTKMHGCGNDYIYVNCMNQTLEHPEQTAIYVSDRHFGVGSDGLILICPSQVADFRMKMYNADGSEGNMCGNGIRCLAKYVYDYGFTDKKKIQVETKSGIKELELMVQNETVTSVKVNMGTPCFECSQIPIYSDKKQFINETIQIDETKYTITCVSMGNPHAVIFVEQIDTFPVQEIGIKMENNVHFPERVNTEFVEIQNTREIKMRVWERGSGETLACGTGACAAVVAGVLNGKTETMVCVHLLGGDLLIEYDTTCNTVWMTGTASTIYHGEIALPQLD